MFGLQQSDTHATNEELYRLAGARPITTIIRERQLQFPEHCLRMKKDEPANIYALYASNIAPVHRRGSPQRTYTEQISDHLIPSEKKKIKSSTAEITKYAQCKPGWIK
jgi:hypothetical protein